MKASPRFAAITTILVLALTLPHTLKGSSLLPLNTAEQVAGSDAVFRGKVVGSTTARGADGLIYTRTSLRVDEALKGKFPNIVAMEHRGGQVENEEEFFGLSPKLVGRGEYLLFVKRNSNGKLECTQGHASAIRLIGTTNSASGEYESPGQDILNETRAIIATSHSDIVMDVTDQAGAATILPLVTTGMLGGVNARFLQPDRGEPIPVLLDADSLPAGMTLSQATNAVLKALNAWTAVTSLRFKIENIGGLGQGADAITISDEKLRIQLHDNYNRISSASTLGIGGRGASTSPTALGWDIGGNVAGNEFFKSTYGYVVLEATNSFLQNTNTFAEVLCHEIGHALNMAHSSEVTTSDPVLLNSIMYFQAHADGRGATLGAYDPPIIRQCYPSNTVPYTYRRFIDVTTASPQPNISGINSVVVPGFDLQGTPLTLLTNGGTVNNGSFSMSGNIIKFTASAAFSDSSRLDPAGTSYYDTLYLRYSDGTNASPYASVRVISFNLDTRPSGASDGIPNNWMLTYFGNIDPVAGVNHGANQDADGDGMKNIDEYRTGMTPTDNASAQRITQLSQTNLTFQAKPYELYELFGSTDLTNWFIAANPIIPTNSTGTFSDLTNAPKMFYRVLKVP